MLDVEDGQLFGPEELQRPPRLPRRLLRLIEHPIPARKIVLLNVDQDQRAFHTHSPLLP
jgi:hypothetical protein